MSGWGFPPRKSVAQRRAEAERALATAAKQGTPLAPVVIEGRKLATTFWGTAWCDNLARYQDFAYRLDRGRSYLRNGAVIDLRIGPGRVDAQVLGSIVYRVVIEIEAIAADPWDAIQRDCAGSIGSLVDLLAGTLSPAVMERLCAKGTGMFPAPAAIRFDCSCPDHASVCKHVAAVMYGIGARLDREPALLFTLRQVSAEDLIASVGRDLPLHRTPARSSRILPVHGLGALFGLDLREDVELPPLEPAPAVGSTRKRSARPAARPARKRRRAE